MLPEITLRLVDDTQIVVPDSLDFSTALILRQRADWSTDEIIMVDQRRDITYPAIFIVGGR
jgi:hypothetical protein